MQFLYSKRRNVISSRAVAITSLKKSGGAPALGGGAQEFGGREPRKNMFIMQNPVFWCILGSENGQLLTEGTARGEGWVGKGWRWRHRRPRRQRRRAEDAEFVDGWRMEKVFPPLQPTTESGERREDAQLLQRDRAAGCVIVFAKSRRLELGNNILRTV